MSDLVIGVIEYASDSVATPSVVVGETVQQVERGMAEILISQVEAGNFEYLGDDWLNEFPAPDLADGDAVRTWLRELWEATTEACPMVFGRGRYTDMR